MNSALISAADLQTMLEQGAMVQICDCSFDLAAPAAGRLAFEAAHLPGANYLHLEADLSAAKTGLNGRHPLPTPEAFAQRLGALGLRDDRPVVAYDNQGGMYAARLWWMLRWIGHAQVQVLDGGLAAWRTLGGQVLSGPSQRSANGPLATEPTDFALAAPLEMAMDHDALRAALAQGLALVVDARSHDRYCGQNETLDPVGGHTPGALNRPFRDNLGPDGSFKTAELLREEWSSMLGGRSPSQTVQQCGSGVTACHNLLALHAAGLSGARLYPGSWSEWCAQPGAPVSTGAQP